MISSHKRRTRYLLAFLCATASLYLIVSKVVVDRVSTLEDICKDGPKSLNTPSSFYLYDKTNNKIDFNTKPYWFNGVQTVRFPSIPSDTTLSAWIKEGKDNRWVILVHGHSNCKKDTHILTVAGMLVRNNFSVLLLDLREHGESTRKDGKHTAGFYESEDVIAAWKWIQTYKGARAEQIGIYGTSFGSGATAIAFKKEPNIQAVWLDAPYADMDKILKGELAFHKLPTSLSLLAHHGCKIFQGIDIQTISPLQSMQHIGSRSVGISYYQHDQRTPVLHGELMCDAAKRYATYPENVVCRPLAQTLQVPGHAPLNHGIGPFIDPSWESTIIGFFKSKLGS